MAPFQSSRGRGSFSRGGRGNGRGGSGGVRGGRGGSGGTRGGRNGPSLPATLMAEVDQTYGVSRGGKTQIRARKEQRKASRQGPKQSTIPNNRQAQFPSPESEGEGEDAIQPPPPVKTKKRKTEITDDGSAKPKKKKKSELTLPTLDKGDAEDGEIEWLEWMLKKEKEKAKGGEDDGLSDGLDDLLDFADVIGPGGKGLKRTNEEHSELDDELLDLHDSEDEDDTLGSDEDEDEDDLEEEDTDGEDEGGDGDSDGEGVSQGQSQHEDSPGIPPEPDLDKSLSASIAETPASTRYIPPQLRAAQLEERAKGDKVTAEERVKLERKAQGLLNKLSEANIDAMLGEIEEVYRGHSRHDVTETLTNLIITAISDKANLLDSFVILYATLVGALHRVIGAEFGGHFTHTLVTRYLSLSPAQQTPSNEAQVASSSNSLYSPPDSGKESLNLLTLISELYNAGVIASGLIYDLIRSFLASNKGEGMNEGDVEGLLRILKCCGIQLRSDDPGSLKDIVNLVLDRTKGKEKEMTSRARFMVETLTNLKSGKSKHTGGNGTGGGETLERMKKFLTSLGKKRRLLATEPLRVGLNDLMSSDTKGKWWLVGNAWSGNPLVDRQSQHESSVRSGNKGKGPVTKVDVEQEEMLLTVARKQGMNTDVRKSVFVVLMSSEDYIHACDRLTALRLNDTQQREFVRVALHCCSIEKNYNPYYTLILNKLCTDSYDHRFTLQYALWDLLKELDGAEKGEMKRLKRKVGNVGKALAYLVARGSIDITIFKAIDWTSLSPLTNLLIQTFLPHLFISSQTISPLFTLSKSWKGYDREALEEVLEKVLVNGEMIAGLKVFGKVKGFGDVEGVGERERGVVEWGKGVLGDVLGRGI